MANALTRWEPFADLAEMRTRLDQVFMDISPRGGHSFMPAMDVVKSNGCLMIKADLPGIKAEEVEIRIEDDILTLCGEHEESHEDKGADWVRKERRFGSFSRSLPLPSGVDPDQITAKTHDGVLEVTVPLPSSSKQSAVTIKPEAT